MIRLAPDVVDYYKELVAQGYSYEEAVELIADDNEIDEYDIKRMLQAAGIDDEDK
jgi:rRNA processing protein Krr1/Pno1